jgi:hypothetical protein
VATVKNFVGGSPVDARVREEIEVPDPATGELLGRVPVSEPEDVDRAVRTAQEAYQEWISRSEKEGAEEVPARGPVRHDRGEHKCPRSRGLLPVYWLEGLLLRRPARHGSRRGRILHKEEGDYRAVVELCKRRRLECRALLAAYPLLEPALKQS